MSNQKHRAKDSDELRSRRNTHVEEEGKLLQLVLAETNVSRLARLEAVAEFLVDLNDLLLGVVLQISRWSRHFQCISKPYQDRKVCYSKNGGEESGTGEGGDREAISRKMNGTRYFFLSGYNPAALGRFLLPFFGLTLG